MMLYQGSDCRLQDFYKKILPEGLEIFLGKTPLDLARRKQP